MISDKDIDKEVIRIRNLKQNKNKSDQILKTVAISNLQKKLFDISNRFVDDAEKKIANNLFDKYLENYGFDDFTEIEKTADLVYTKILKLRLEKNINDLAEKKIVPHKDLTLQYSGLLDQISKMERELGLFQKDKSEDELTGLQKLRKYFEMLINFNKTEFSTICGKCGSLMLLRRRVKDFETIKHPFFSGRFYYNYRGIELVKKGIWTKEQYAYVFYTSPRYVDWCLEHENEIIDVDNVPTDTLERYINDCDHLPNVDKIDGKLKKSEKQFKNFEE